MTVHEVDPRTSIVDLNFRGNSGAIGTGVLECGDGIALVDPGPATCLEALRAGIRQAGFELADTRAILLTHIHLDHAAATGTIVKEVPGAQVYVHRIGAVHMNRPERFLASAKRIYGDLLETLWGEFLAVPSRSIVEVDEGGAIRIGDRTLSVAYAPGHAKHHVAYYEKESESAWVGDVGGIRILPGGAIPVTPPPDIDLELWRASMDRVLAWNPGRLIPTHFGVIDDPAAHFAELSEQLGIWGRRVRESLAADGGNAGADGGNAGADGGNRSLAPPDGAADRARAKSFAEWAEKDLRTRMPAGAVDRYVAAFGPIDSWWGLARYWRTRSGA